MNMPTLLIGIVCGFALLTPAQAYEPEQILIPNVTGAASDATHGAFENLVNGSGLVNWTHNANAYGEGMSTSITGPYRVQFNFDTVYKVGHIYVWNQNQPNYLDRGLKNVLITYTKDGRTWLKANPGMFTLTKGTGLNGLTFDTLDLGGVEARSVRITAATKEGNYGSDLYGLSEVRFGLHGTNRLPQQRLIENVTGSVNDATEGSFDDLVNGAGLVDWTHNANGIGDGMWLTNAGTAPYLAEFNFDAVYNVGHIYVWNHNQTNHLDRGLKNVNITYTSDGTTWLEAGLGKFTLTQGTGTNGQTYDILDLGGVDARSVRIKAAAVGGNYGSAAYHGLSEVRFGLHGTQYGVPDGPVIVEDLFGRELNDYQATLVDWQGYLYNPMIELKLTPPKTGIIYPLSVTVKAEGSSRLMLDVPSTLSSTGATKVLTFNQYETQPIFLAIAPDRVGGGEIESYTLRFDYQGASSSIPIKVIDQDDDLEPSLPLVFDYRLDTVNSIFDAQHIRTATELAIKDWFYFFDFSSFDEVPVGDQEMALPGNDWQNHEAMKNEVAYSGFWIGLRGIDSPYSTGYPTGNGKYHSQNGVQVPGPLHRSAALILHAGGYVEKGPVPWTSVEDDEWHVPGSGGLYGLMHHEFGHSIAFHSAWAGMAHYAANYKDDAVAKRVIEYQGAPAGIDGYYHIGAPGGWDRLSGQSAGYVSKFPGGRWMPMKLSLLMAEHAGWKLRDDITPFMKPEIVTTELAGAVTGQAYSQTLSSNGGGVAFYDWTIASGSLPSGLTLNRFTGEISGTVTAGAGTYDFTVRLKDYDELQAAFTKPLSIAVTATPGTTLEAWRRLHGLAADGSEDALDSDSDEHTSLMEFALGLDPTVKDITNHPQTSQDKDGGNTYLTLTFRRRIGGAIVSNTWQVDGISYIVEVSDDLQAANWDSDASTVEWGNLATDNGDGTETIRCRMKKPIDPAGVRYFIRLRVEETS